MKKSKILTPIMSNPIVPVILLSGKNVAKTNILHNCVIA